MRQSVPSCCLRAIVSLASRFLFRTASLATPRHACSMPLFCLLDCFFEPPAATFPLLSLALAVKAGRAGARQSYQGKISKLDDKGKKKACGSQSGPCLPATAPPQCLSPWRTNDEQHPNDSRLGPTMRGLAKKAYKCECGESETVLHILFDCPLLEEALRKRIL